MLFAARRGRIVAECGRLLSDYPELIGIEGSNPSPSASISTADPFLRLLPQAFVRSAILTA